MFEDVFANMAPTNFHSWQYGGQATQSRICRNVVDISCFGKYLTQHLSIFRLMQHHSTVFIFIFHIYFKINLLYPFSDFPFSELWQSILHCWPVACVARTAREQLSCLAVGCQVRLAGTVLSRGSLRAGLAEAVINLDYLHMIRWTVRSWERLASGLRNTRKLRIIWWRI